MNHKSFLFLSLFIAYLSCSQSEADLSRIDDQIEQSQYAQARELLLAEQKKSFSDTMQYARIETRLQRIDQLIYFNDLENLVLQEEWLNAEQSWHKKKLSLKDSTISSQTDFRFTLFHLHAVIDSGLNRPDSMYFFLQKAIQEPTTQRDLLQTDLEKLAFHLAKQDSLIAARRLFDQSLRMVKLSQIDSSLQQAYFLYLDGKFVKCKKRLLLVPDTYKSKHWKNLQLFLEIYADRLTLEDRFKLW